MTKAPKERIRNMAKADKLLKRVNKWVEENPLTPQQLDKIGKYRASSGKYGLDK